VSKPRGRVKPLLKDHSSMRFHSTCQAQAAGCLRRYRLVVLSKKEELGDLSRGGSTIEVRALTLKTSLMRAVSMEIIKDNNLSLSHANSLSFICLYD
jgi:hypothetical protein